jgi:hypothetical protein
MTRREWLDGLDGRLAELRRRLTRTRSSQRSGRKWRRGLVKHGGVDGRSKWPGDTCTPMQCLQLFTVWIRRSQKVGDPSSMPDPIEDEP